MFKKSDRSKVWRVVLMALIIAVGVLITSIAFAASSVKVSGSVGAMTLMTSSTQKPGETVRYKLKITKPGIVNVFLKDKAVGKDVKIASTTCKSAGYVLVEIPGEKIQDDKQYTLTVKLVNNTTIGTATTTISTIKPKAEISSLSVNGMVTPTRGDVLTVSYTIPFDSYVNAWITNSSGTKLVTLANNKAAKAGENYFYWNAMLSNTVVAPTGKYTVHINCNNQAGSSETSKVQFTINGATNALGATVAGTLRTAVFPTFPKEGVNSSIYLNTTYEGPYQLKLKDMTTGKMVTQSGKLTLRVAEIKIPGSALKGGHKYTLAIAHYVNGSVKGKATFNFVAQYPDPPVVNSFNVPATLKANYGAAAKVTYSVSSTCKATIVVRDGDGNLKARIASSAKASAGSNYAYWTGRGVDGKFLPSGTYYVSISVTGPGGTTTYPAQMMEYTTPGGSMKPAVTGSITAFSPLSDPTQAERTSAKFLVRTTVSGTLSVTMSASGKKKTVYKEAIGVGYSVITIPRTYMTAGTYTMTATLTRDGKSCGTGVAYFSPRKVSPQVTNLTGTSQFDVGTREWFTGSVTTASSGKMYVRVYNSSNTLVRTLVSGKSMETGTLSISWNGCNEAGDRVPAGNYTVKAYYVDDFDVSSATVSYPVRVTKRAYPSGVYDYVYIGAGTFKTKITLYSNTSGKELGYTYGQSATFVPLENKGTYWYVKASMPTGTPVYCYVKASSLMLSPVNTDYRIEICIDRTGSKAQMFYLYKGGTLLKSFHCSTGMVEGSTPCGDFIITNRMPYFTNSGALCEHAIRVCGGSCIHRVPKLDGSYKGTTKLLGQVASHGCIRIPVEESEWFYTNIPDTTPVHIFKTK